MIRTLSILAFTTTLILGNPEGNDTDAIPRVDPVASWSFDRKEPGLLTGSAAFTPDGPQQPTYPGFAKGNRALTIARPGDALRIREGDLPDDNLRFTHGETITIEAWVNPTSLASSTYTYIIGKGRNKSPGFPSENQNWALRLTGAGPQAVPSFLFRSRNPETREENYHRWNAGSGFIIGGWHHVAVTYTFGEPESIAAFVDGKKVVNGAWDMGGPTRMPPVSDADDVMIGTGSGGGESNTFPGAIDEVAIYRQSLPDQILAGRYLYVAPAAPLEPANIPAGKVLVQICEDGLPNATAWPNKAPSPTETLQIDAFGLAGIPHKYVSTGIRGDRQLPFFMRLAARVTLPPGKHRLLVRGRSANRLLIDGKQVIITDFSSGDLGGQGSISSQNNFLDLGDPDFRFVQPGDHEAWTEWTSDGGEHLFVLEKILGTSGMRPETGETVVAVSLEGTRDWLLVAPGKPTIRYNDRDWSTYKEEQDKWLEQENSSRRARARSTHSAYWNRRREIAAEYLAATEEVPVPPATPGMAALNAIDHFINARIKETETQHKQAPADGVNFHREILPIFENKCFSCHQGGKTKGGLKLDSLAHALKGGKGDGPGIVPGSASDSSIFMRVTEEDADYIMPPKGDKLTRNEIGLLENWINQGAHWPEFDVPTLKVTGPADDLTFLRRIFLDTVGVPPTAEDIAGFQLDKSSDKRAKLIDRLLLDPRWADKWMGYWQDVLAENPNILNPTLNNTGPFRWWIQESLLDNKPMDLFVTELVRMEGSDRFGGTAGFGTATGNDSPMAAKGAIISSAFMGVEMKCARCHDAPAHTYLQQDLFEIGALLQKSPLTVPATSSVPMDKLHQGGRKSLIEVTLQPGTPVAPAWPFTELVSKEIGVQLAADPDDSRDLLAALITAPQNQRFAQVTANRIWQQIMSRGIVDVVEDWQKSRPTHPELIQWLGREFTRSGYDMKAIARLIFNSQAYQRASDPTLLRTNPLFTAPAPRRLSAEQIVDSLFHATGKRFDTEEVSLDIDGKRTLVNSITLGKPKRSWMLASTSNERDRPSLSLPRVQAVSDVLEAFGWRGSRQDATSTRETEPNALQPAIIANGTVGVWLTRLSDDHPLTLMVMEDQTPEELLDKLFLRLLTRHPLPLEKETYLPVISEGYTTRIVEPPGASPLVPALRGPAKYVTWTNHLDAEAEIIRARETLAARAGDPPTARLSSAWRNHFEDVLWAILNSPEWIYLK